jgi:hypothetical protein
MLAALVLALALMVPAITSAQTPGPPHIFTGTATLDGQPAANGTLVTAWIDGVQVSKNLAAYSNGVVGGRYGIQVEEVPGKPFGGKSVRFKIGSADATQSQNWVSGEVTPLNLTATSGPPPTAVPPTAVPTVRPPPTGVPGVPGAKGDKGDKGDPSTVPGPKGDPSTVPGPQGKGAGPLGWIALIVAIVAIIGVGVALMKKPKPATP